MTEYSREEKIEKLKNGIKNAKFNISINEETLSHMQKGDIVNCKDYWEYEEELKEDKLTKQAYELLLKKLEKGEAK